MPTCDTVLAVTERRGAYCVTRSGRALRWTLAVAAVAAAAALAGCGSSSSSTPAKPAYCSNVTALKKSINDLPSAVAGGVSGLQTALAKVQTQTTAIVASAKSDFPQQTQALSSSLDQLEKTVKGLPSSPSASQVATLTLQATSTVNAAKSFISATKKKCG
jgi:ABC-type oligopeptide transport system substrate-binding subunit